ncbi:hypothetical protein DFA_06907 [Cavenderia fasciculata]|uniref:Ankyrin repeat-containing protein n=1 Tax=Cavenderia fasciculata TaxID=261658 RepID=F4PX02_CACFS|nr:uncharacterized protein DFA_06907 [Cavenderia fasciculata]EGG19805.1 hypothetical protein DFA_06907 [Cavenderia fasciculata]|eukprot:XP_004358151.1 hypothetical protein DFA_06907 [Cavenderia fasciculata]
MGKSNKGTTASANKAQPVEKSIDDMDEEELKMAIAQGKLQRSKIDDDVQQFLDDCANSKTNNIKETLEDATKRERLINQHDANGRTALHFACHSGSQVTFNLLLENGANIDAIDFSGYTPLMLAIKLSHTHLALELIARKCNLDVVSKEGFTALHLAVLSKDTQVVKRLVEANCKISTEKTVAGSVLHSACGVSKESLQIIDILVKKEPKLLESLDENDMTPLHLACAYGNTLLALELIKLGANVNAVAREGVTPLHICVDSENIVLIKAMVDKGVVLKMDADGETPRVMAVKKKNKTLEEMLASCKLDATPYQAGKDSASAVGNNPTPDALKDNGNTAFRRGEYEIALNWYQLAIDVEDVTAEVKAASSTSKQPESIAHILYSNKSACHYNLKNYVEALMDADKSIELAPSWPKGYFRRAQALEALGRKDEAEQATKKMNELEGKK